MSKIKQIQALVRNGLYYFIEHAYEEAAADDFDIYDVEQGILSGKIRRSWPKEGKFELIGSALDGRPMGVVGRGGGAPAGRIGAGIDPLKTQFAERGRPSREAVMVGTTVPTIPADDP